MSHPLHRPARLANYWDLFDRLRDPTFLLHPESNTIVDANDACENVIGVPAEALRGRPLLQFVQPEDQASFEKSLRMARRRYHPHKFESRWQTPMGSELLMEVTACALQLQDHSSVLQIICRDMTEVREAERKMKHYVDELSALNKKLELLSVTDELTGLANVRHFKAELQQEYQRCARFGSEFSIIFGDVDHFKHYNDRNGHPAGDQVLRGVAAALKAECRTTDLPARYGGEEFVILCTGCDEQGARVLAERIRIRIEGTPFSHAQNQPLGKVSMSLGIAHWKGETADPLEVLRSADLALYASKQSGRNRITLFSEIAQQKIPQAG